MAVMAYQTQDGLADYGFSIDFQSDRGWRIHIVFQPFRKEHDENLRLPYQFIDGNGCRYVDWPEKLYSLGDAKTVAALWAELAHRYQRSREEHALYIELIKHHQQAQKKRRATPAGPDRPGDAVGAGGAGALHQDCGPVIPHSRAG